MEHHESDHACSFAGKSVSGNIEYWIIQCCICQPSSTPCPLSLCTYYLQVSNLSVARRVVGLAQTQSPQGNL